ncbi:MAG: sigma-54 factor interaction domain-containing protein [Paludibaculum sp.]
MTVDSSQKSYELVGQSARLRQVLRLAAKLGKGHWPVLLLGETGTGKELVARTIHRNSPSGPFVTIDCSAMVGPLMESELFGHAKGAFTGAHTQKIGLIEQADGGTAFFDEIGELPLDLQSKLLRVLQEKEFRPVGSLQVRKSSFRVVAATNRDLAEKYARAPSARIFTTASMWSRCASLPCGSARTICPLSSPTSWKPTGTVTGSAEICWS